MSAARSWVKRTTFAYLKLAAAVVVIIIVDQARKVRNENRQAARTLDLIQHGARGRSS